MSGFIDLHAHFIYGVDDGAQTAETMYAMLDAAVLDHVTTLFATSHATPGMQAFPQQLYTARLEEARAYCRAKNHPLTLWPGAEILYSPAFRSIAMEHALPTYADTRWILLEFLPSISAKELETALEEAARCGYSIVLAHIERYPCLEHGRLLAELRQRYPIRCQVNASTILVPGGFFRKRRIDHWLREGLIDAISSDAHGTHHRPTQMQAAYSALEAVYGASFADQLTGRNGNWLTALLP